MTQVADKKYIGIYAIGNIQDDVEFIASSYDKAEAGFKAYCCDNNLQYITVLGTADKRQNRAKFVEIGSDG